MVLNFETVSQTLIPIRLLTTNKDGQKHMTNDERHDGPCDVCHEAQSADDQRRSGEIFFPRVRDIV